MTDKIANTKELEQELRRLLVLAQTEQPSREMIANELQGLSERLMPKTALMDERAFMDMLFRTRNGDLEPALERMKAAKIKWVRNGPSDKGKPFHDLMASIATLGACLDGLQALFDEKGWR
jgi:hypothetical protein